MTTNQLIEAHMDFAGKISSKLYKKLPDRIDFDEILSAAYFGLVESANRFDEKINKNFKSFCFLRIRGAIIEYVRKFYFKEMESFDLNEHNIFSKKSCAEDFIDLFKKDLTPNNHTILKLYYIESLNLQEISKKCKMSQSRVSQILKESRSNIALNYDRNELWEKLVA